ncbi:protein TolQ [Caulobacter segnis]|jgi:biopolymer transport protein TolQ|uniref:Protein TolQ n=2 Tax=Caulobacter segnis TaxID=88688 RepID=D5VEQ2_CAUST|nr:protein TolQ [Caulobacter segnis]ADG09195.1 protein TolQ [Caulobacter segnis ATCC 21756]AVQ01011.1 protein TolQ [Caulobacter segnis]
MDASAAAPNFSFFALFMQADWVVKGVMIGLILASLGSWAVILDKLFRFTNLNRAADRFEEQVSGGRSLEDVAGEAGANPPHALPRMLQAALKEWREAKTRAMTENQTAFLVARIDRILDTMIARETAKVEEGLGSLAIVATASPFIGLFGTVWGIMHAFQNIALSKNTSLAVVAPSIAEALFATAVGLIAAIPAYIAYNKFSTDAGKYAGRLEGFADDLSTAIQRRLTERA